MTRTLSECEGYEVTRVSPRGFVRVLACSLYCIKGEGAGSGKELPLTVPIHSALARIV